MFKNYFYSALVFGAVLTVLSTFVLVNQSPNALAADGPQQIIPGEISPITVGDALNVSTIDETTFFSGQPTAMSLTEFQKKGVKTVINLRTPEEMESVDFEESQLVEALGITYINIPVGNGEPDDETIRLILETIDENSDEPLLLHCASSNRVGYVWAMYQGTRGGESLQSAIELGKQAGMTNAGLEARASSYITRQSNGN